MSERKNYLIPQHERTLSAYPETRKNTSGYPSSRGCRLR